MTELKVSLVMYLPSGLVFLGLENLDENWIKIDWGKAMFYGF